MTSDFQIKTHHWGLTALFAVSLHLALLLNFKHEAPQSQAANTTQNELVISLKKFKSPSANEQAPVKRQVTSKPELQVKPQPKTIPPEKPKPVVKQKPIIQKQAKPVIKPTVEPLTEIVAPSNPAPTAKPSEVAIPKNNSQSQLANVSQADDAIYINEKNRYLNQLVVWLSKHKRYPASARRRDQQGTVVVRFVIDTQGQLLSHSIVEPSRHSSLNNAAIRMLKSASPMPKVPDNLINNKQKFEYTIPVAFSLINN